MQLRPGTRFIERHLNICSNFGGLGDSIARLPAIRYINENHPHVRVTVYWHDYFLEIAKVLLPENPMLRHQVISQMKYADDGIPLLDFNTKYLTSISLSLIEHGFLMLTGRPPESEKDWIYPKYVSSRDNVRQALGAYVVLTPCFTSRTREWKGNEINETVRGVQALGYKVVFLGKTEPVWHGNGKKIMGGIPDGLDRSLVDLDLIDKLSLTECFDVLASAECVVGVDNGLLHMTACTDTPSVWGFTSVLEEHRLPRGIKSASIYPEVSCHGCQSRCFLVKHDFTKCIWDDYVCVSQMTAEKFLQGIKKVLDIP